MRASETGSGPEPRDAPCPGCGAVPPPLPAQAAPSHPYMTASAACWSAYGQLLAAQYADPARMLFHQLLVDAYAVQHPGDPGDPTTAGAAAVTDDGSPVAGVRDRRAVQSVGIHLMTLCLFFEHEADPAEGTRLHRRMVARPAFSALRPPTHRGNLTFLGVPLSGPVDQVRSAAWSWARSSWVAWSGHHDEVRRWLVASGLVTS